MMKFKYILPIIGVILTFSDVYARTPNEAIEFFNNKYAMYANNYNAELLNLYSPDVKVIREVVKPSGQTVDVVVPAQRYFKELKIGQKTAKLRRYKNKYRNVKAEKVPNGIKISAERQPSRENYWLKMYQILEDTDSGFKIKEEMMQTKVQSFLNQQEKGE